MTTADSKTIAADVARLVEADAADPRLAAAYRGECPGVDPDELMRRRAETRAARQGRSVEELLADVERAREALRAAPLSEPGCGSYEGAIVYDLRWRDVPELPEAAAREGVAYITTVVKRGGRRQVVLGGITTRAVVRAFREEWEPRTRVRIGRPGSGPWVRLRDRR